MIRKSPVLAGFERELIRNRPADFALNSRVFEALYREALTLGVLPPRDRLEGIEVDRRIARALHVRGTS